MKKASIFALLFASALSLVGCGNKAASIGIIGGADGPTAIFVTTGINWMRILGVIVVAILAAVIIYRNKKKK